VWGLGLALVRWDKIMANGQSIMFTTEENMLIACPRDSMAVDQAIAFARRWAKDWATWCICVEYILNEWGLDWC
jgi:hypothetical protein